MFNGDTEKLGLNDGTDGLELVSKLGTVDGAKLERSDGFSVSGSDGATDSTLEGIELGESDGAGATRNTKSSASEYCTS